MGLLRERLRERRRAEQVNTPMSVIPIVPAPLRTVTRPSESGEVTETKQCRQCEEVKTVNDFYPHYSKPGHEARCKRCRTDYRRPRVDRWQEENRERYHDYQRDYRQGKRKPTKKSAMPDPARPPSTCATCGIVVGGKQKDVRYCKTCWPLREKELHKGYYAKEVAARPPKPQVPCARCGTVFIQPTVRTRYCSHRCRQAVRIEQNTTRRRLAKDVRVAPLPKRINVKPGSAMEAEIAHNESRKKRGANAEV